MKTILFLGTALLLATGTAQAQAAYKCRDSQGRLMYSDVPCPAGGESTTVDVSDKVTGEQRTQARDLLQKDLARIERERQKGNPVPTADPVAVTRQSCLSHVREVKVAASLMAKLTVGCHNIAVAKDSAQVQNCLADINDRQIANSRRAAAIAGCHGAVVGQDRERNSDVGSANRTNGLRQITSCDAGGCWDERGGRYTGSGTSFVGTDGRMCQKIGTQLQCP